MRSAGATSQHYPSWLSAQRSKAAMTHILWKNSGWVIPSHSSFEIRSQWAITASGKIFIHSHLEEHSTCHLIPIRDCRTESGIKCQQFHTEKSNPRLPVQWISTTFVAFFRTHHQWQGNTSELAHGSCRKQSPAYQRKEQHSSGASSTAKRSWRRGHGSSILKIKQYLFHKTRIFCFSTN